MTTLMNKKSLIQASMEAMKLSALALAESAGPNTTELMDYEFRENQRTLGNAYMLQSLVFAVLAVALDNTSDISQLVVPNNWNQK